MKEWKYSISEKRTPFWLLITSQLYYVIWAYELPNATNVSSRTSVMLQQADELESSYLVWWIRWKWGNIHFSKLNKQNTMNIPRVCFYPTQFRCHLLVSQLLRSKYQMNRCENLVTWAAANFCLFFWGFFRLVVWNRI